MSDKKFILQRARLTLTIFTLVAASGYLLSLGLFYSLNLNNQRLTSKIQAAAVENKSTKDKLFSIKSQLEDLKIQDQYVINKKLTADIKAIEPTYDKPVEAFAKL